MDKILSHLIAGKIIEYQPLQSEEELRTKLRTAEEEVVSVRDRLNSTNKNYTSTFEELQGVEAKLQRTKGTCMRKGLYFIKIFM